jgi:acetyl-CoA decarbonylase/synthase complex subunit gamma
MAVYKLLPRTNCKACGEPTCFTFALRLAAAQAEVEACPGLFEPAQAQNLAELRSMLIDAPSIG